MERKVRTGVRTERARSELSGRVLLLKLTEASAYDLIEHRVAARSGPPPCCFVRACLDDGTSEYQADHEGHAWGTLRHGAKKPVEFVTVGEDQLELVSEGAATLWCELRHSPMREVVTEPCECIKEWAERRS